MLTKTDKRTIRRLQQRGGYIVEFPTECGTDYHHSWGELLVNGHTKWHRSRITPTSFKRLYPYLLMIDSNEDDIAEYELTHAAQDMNCKE